MKYRASAPNGAKFEDSVIVSEIACDNVASRRPTVSVAGRSQGALGSVAGRWALFVLKTLENDSDTRTISAWARTLGVSRTGLCECCRLVHVVPREARDFARLMRTVYQSGQQWQPEALLDLSDARTLKKLLMRAGLSDAEICAPTVREFLHRQLLIPQNNAGLTALRTLLFGDVDGASGSPGRPESS